MALQFVLLAASAAAKFGMQSMNNRVEDQAMGEQQYFNDLSFETSRNEIGLRMDQESLAASEQNLFNINRLRDVLSTQRAMMGARGQREGVGSGNMVQNKAINVYNADEKARNLNLSFKRLQLQGQTRALSLKKLVGESKISNYKSKRQFQQTQDWLKTGLNMFTQAWGQGRNG